MGEKRKMRMKEQKGRRTLGDRNRREKGREDTENKSLRSDSWG